jgi:hypothetical protein
MPKDYVKAVGGLMYIWGWPLVNLHNRRLIFSKVPEYGLGDGVLPLAPLNRLTMLTDYIKPEERSVATPNQDTVYGFGLLSLDQGPVVFQIPDFGDRFWIYQIGNQRTDAIGAVGALYGTKPGFYLIGGPTWDGNCPEGIASAFRSDTNIAYIIPRAFMDDTAADRAAIQPIVSRILAYPVAEYDRKLKTQDWSRLPTLSDPSGGGSGGGGETQWVKPESFFEEMPLILREVPPLPGEESLYALFGSVLDAASSDPATAAALREAALETDAGLLTELHRYYYAGVPVRNGWVSPMNGAHWGTDYLSRTAAGKSNIFCNARAESAYFNQEYDANGDRLTGKRAYKVTFLKGSTPPVRGFWSLSLYNKQHFFDANQINRFSIGTKNRELKYENDGSLTIYVQNSRPSESLVSNWLPAPEDEFELFVRAYWPLEQILSNEWAPPAVEISTQV